MLRPSRKIPKVAAATLLLGGCGGDDGGSTPSASSIFTDFCSHWQDCDPTGFAAEYASVEACASTLQGYIDDYTTYGGADCGDAFVDYYHCLNENYYNADCSVNDGADDACYVPFQAACGF